MRHGPTPLAVHIVAAWSTGDAALLAKFHAGVRRYQASRWRRPASEPEVFWQNGSTRLLRYGAAGGTPLLIIPSLVNPCWVLDLVPENSLIAWLSTQGFQPYLLDWGVADKATRQLDLDGLVVQHLHPALMAMGAPAHVLGYCLGGTMAVALACRDPSRVKSLAVLAAPWRWSCYDAGHRHAMGEMMAASAGGLAAWGAMPADQIQMLFARLDPQLIVDKFARFADVAEGSAAEQTFLALEDWSNGGAPLSAPVARQLFEGWIAGGLAAWPGIVLGGIDPATLSLPALVVTAIPDRIVPEAVALPLADLLPNATLMRIAAGHVGMVVGSKAKQLLWQPLAAWLHGQTI